MSVPTEAVDDVSRLQFAVLQVLRGGDKAEIRASVVEPVPVDVVDLEVVIGRAAHHDTVQQAAGIGIWRRIRPR